MSSGRSFAKKVLRENPGLTRDEFVRKVWHERLAQGKSFKFGSLNRHAKAVYDGCPAKPQWAPTPAQVREAIKWWPGHKLNFLEAKTISEQPEVPTRFRGEPLRRALMWLGK